MVMLLLSFHTHQTSKSKPEEEGSEEVKERRQREEEGSAEVKEKKQRIKKEKEQGREQTNMMCNVTPVFVIAFLCSCCLCCQTLLFILNEHY